MGDFGAGPSGTCVCPRCGREVGHERGTPCSKVICPGCQTPMTRKQ